jgi:hypothetical protein
MLGKKTILGALMTMAASSHAKYSWSCFRFKIEESASAGTQVQR